ncbi:MAG: hypothetical protein UU10_C0022G0008 [Parcubacteria group bacterium GW2011_GWF1_40_6]|nr:MAG: hypothetical protein UU10_C0022G0008 [Parcubacteria group bacterium GW2011_GWF1_40_6]HLA29300.1 hypothetical protein [Syntrophales bacterium]
MAVCGVKGKIDKIVMEQKIKAGESYAAIGAYFGVGRESVRMAHKRLGGAVESTPELIEKSELSKGNLDTINQLVKINSAIMDELDRARRLILREDIKVKERERLEDQVERDPTRTDLVEKLKEKANINFSNILKIQASVIDISAEVRKQLELQIKIAETLYSATMVAQFQEEVLNAIASADTNVRTRIIVKLKELRTIRGLIQIKK